MNFLLDFRLNFRFTFRFNFHQGTPPARTLGGQGGAQCCLLLGLPKEEPRRWCAAATATSARDPRLAAGRTCCRFDRIDFAAFLTTSRTNASDASDGGLAEKERIVQVYHLIILFVCENSTLKLVRDDETHGKQSFSRPRTWPGPI